MRYAKLSNYLGPNGSIRRFGGSRPLATEKARKYLRLNFANGVPIRLSAKIPLAFDFIRLGRRTRSRRVQGRPFDGAAVRLKRANLGFALSLTSGQLEFREAPRPHSSRIANHISWLLADL